MKKRNTKDRLADELVRMANRKSIDAITIKDLTAACHVSRQTFYYYYDDITDIVRYELDRDLKKLTAARKTGLSTEEMLGLVVHWAVENRSLIRKMQDSRLLREMNRLLIRAFRANARKYIRSHFGREPEELSERRELGIEISTYGLTVYLAERCQAERIDEKKLAAELAGVFRGELGVLGGMRVDAADGTGMADGGLKRAEEKPMGELRGSLLANVIAAELPARIAKLQHTPVLAIARIGERPDDLAYERGAVKRMEKLGLATRIFNWPRDVENDTFLADFRKINADPAIDGILLMRPMPAQIDEEAVIAAMDPAKDLDGITPVNMGLVFKNDPRGFAPAVAEAAVRLIREAGVPIRGRRVTIVGRSVVVGRPLELLFLREDATVTVCHTKTENLPERCREADILVSCAGRRNLIGRDAVKPGAVVVDVGINVDENGKLCGDVNAAEVAETAGLITPVPGGVGAATTSVLAEHLVRAAERREEALAGAVFSAPAEKKEEISNRKLTLDEFAERTWSAAPAPGGGAVAACSGALAASLAGMAANLTAGKKKYLDVTPEMRRIASESAGLREKLLQDVDRDSRAFDGYMAALRLPKETEEEKKIRGEKLEEELSRAAEVPLACAETALKVLPLAEAVVRRGNPGLITDGLIAAMEARTAVEAAALNVRVNLGSLRDRELAARLESKCAALLSAAREGESAVLSLSGLSRRDGK
jgi:methylenetetrahydrofolate dehydrogenase (NADP+)/methenyltetrahydrofolate cyclohydrolase